jgi:ubiquinone/menaquinone biosynthesis C-methylase UbiE
MLSQKQYETPQNFNARVYLTAKFKTNPETWNRWIFKHLPAAEDLRILELGCGTGIFWRLNGQKVPKSWRITLTDYSQGMLETTKQNLRGIDLAFDFEIARAEDLPYPEDSFDIVIANLMLYHIADRNTALAGIARVLKTGGSFVASTYGRQNMLELNLLLDSYLKKIGKIKPHRDNPFSLENGYQQLTPFFSKVRLLRYEDHLEISETEPIINYFLSFNNITEGWALFEEKDISGFRNILEMELQKNTLIKVTKDTGMFFCEK